MFNCGVLYVYLSLLLSPALCTPVLCVLFYCAECNTGFRRQSLIQGGIVCSTGCIAHVGRSVRFIIEEGISDYWISLLCSQRRDIVGGLGTSLRCRRRDPFMILPKVTHCRHFACPRRCHLAACGCPEIRGVFKTYNKGNSFPFDEDNRKQ